MNDINNITQKYLDEGFFTKSKEDIMSSNIINSMKGVIKRVLTGTPYAKKIEFKEKVDMIKDIYVSTDILKVVYDSRKKHFVLKLIKKVSTDIKAQIFDTMVDNYKILKNKFRTDGSMIFTRKRLTEDIDMSDVLNKIDSYLNEDKTEDAAKTLAACIKFYDGQESLDDKGKEVLGKLKGMKDYYEKEGSFSPGQAKAIFNISQGISKMTGK